MPLDAIKQVAKAEQLALQRKNEAKAAGKKRLEEAEQDGRALLDRAGTEAAVAVKALLLEAERQAAEDALESLAETEEACAALRSSAEARMDQAAALILERVVKI